MDLIFAQSIYIVLVVVVLFACLYVFFHRVYSERITYCSARIATNKQANISHFLRKPDMSRELKQVHVSAFGNHILTAYSAGQCYFCPYMHSAGSWRLTAPTDS